MRFMRHALGPLERVFKPLGGSPAQWISAPSARPTP